MSTSTRRLRKWAHTAIGAAEVTNETANEHHSLCTRATPNTILGKVLVAYHGWYTCPGDGPPLYQGHHGWHKWFEHPITERGHPRFDLYPDVESYSPSELYPVPGLTLTDSQPAKLFSSRNPATVNKHFHLMAEHAIDGAFIVRVAAECEVDGDSWSPLANLMRISDEVLDHVRAAAEAEGRVWAIMYDLTGLSSPRLAQTLRVDWAHLVLHKRILESPNYLREGGKPVIGIKGLGIKGAYHDPTMVLDIIKQVRSWTPGGAYVLAGVSPSWRIPGEGDHDHNPAFSTLYKDVDAIAPWSVGRTTDTETSDWYAAEIKEDVKTIRGWNQDTLGQKRVDYIGVVFPGLSRSNLMHGAPYNEIPRKGGSFLWRQIYHLQREGAHTVIIESFDDFNSSTAILPAVTLGRLLPNGARFLSLDADGDTNLPPDWYLRICGMAGEAFRGEKRIATDLMPKKELDDYWGMRPKYEEDASASEAGASGSSSSYPYSDGPSPPEPAASSSGAGGSGSTSQPGPPMRSGTVDFDNMGPPPPAYSLVDELPQPEAQPEATQTVSPQPVVQPLPPQATSQASALPLHSAPIPHAPVVASQTQEERSELPYAAPEQPVQAPPQPPMARRPTVPQPQAPPPQPQYQPPMPSQIPPSPQPIRNSAPPAVNSYYNGPSGDPYPGRGRPDGPMNPSNLPMGALSLTDSQPPTPQGRRPSFNAQGPPPSSFNQYGPAPAPVPGPGPSRPYSRPPSRPSSQGPGSPHVSVRPGEIFPTGAFSSRPSSQGPAPYAPGPGPHLPTSAPPNSSMFPMGPGISLNPNSGPGSRPYTPGSGSSSPNRPPGSPIRTEPGFALPQGPGPAIDGPVGGGFASPDLIRQQSVRMQANAMPPPPMHPQRIGQPGGRPPPPTSRPSGPSPNPSFSNSSYSTPAPPGSFPPGPSPPMGSGNFPPSTYPGAPRPPPGGPPSLPVGPPPSASTYPGGPAPAGNYAPYGGQGPPAPNQFPAGPSSHAPYANYGGSSYSQSGPAANSSYFPGYPQPGGPSGSGPGFLGGPPPPVSRPSGASPPPGPGFPGGPPPSHPSLPPRQNSSSSTSSTTFPVASTSPRPSTFGGFHMPAAITTPAMSALDRYAGEERRKKLEQGFDSASKWLNNLRK